MVARRSDIRMINLQVEYSIDLKLDIQSTMTNVVDVAVDTQQGIHFFYICSIFRVVGVFLCQVVLMPDVKLY